MKRELERRYIYDAAQRCLHWWIAVSIMLLVVSGLIGANVEGSQRAFVWDIHIIIAKVLLVGFAGRIVWGLIGPTHALFWALVHPRAWIHSIKTREVATADADFGHHAQAAASYLIFYGLVVLMAGSGLILAAVIHGKGPLADRFLDDFTNFELIRGVHEYGWWAIAFFAVTHVAALIYHERRDCIPIAQAMISGFQYRSAEKKGDPK